MTGRTIEFDYRSGEGTVFTDGEARFRFTPDRLEILAPEALDTQAQLELVTAALLEEYQQSSRLQTLQEQGGEKGQALEEVAAFALAKYNRLIFFTQPWKTLKTFAWRTLVNFYDTRFMQYIFSFGILTRFKAFVLRLFSKKKN